MARPTYAEINLDAIIQNTRAVKKLIGGKKICAAVKADGYGHGAVAAAYAMCAGGADMLAVAMTEEAVQLRKAGIARPVILLSPAPREDIDTILDLGITACISDVPFAGELSAAAVRRGATARAQVNVDTGMGRVGFPCASAADAIMTIQQLPGLEIEGLFTHFACSEDVSVTAEQLRMFKYVTDRLKSAGMTLPLLHAANSAATLQMPDAHLQCVRPGLILYGLYPPGADASGVVLRPAMSLHSRVVFCKKVSAGTRLGYGHTFTTERDSLIATLPLGYHDGYLRQYSNRGEVLIKGKRAPVVGRVSMDQTLVDVTDVPQAGEGAEVVIYGRQGDSSIRVEEMAARLERIPYELTCAVAARVRRRYILNSTVVGETSSCSQDVPEGLRNYFPGSTINVPPPGGDGNFFPRSF